MRFAEYGKRLVEYMKAHPGVVRSLIAALAFALGYELGAKELAIIDAILEVIF